MSDVDDSNLRTLQDNTSNMIELQLSRIKSKNDSIELPPPSKQTNNASPAKKPRQEEEEEKQEEDSDEGFYDCFDNQQDIKMLEQTMARAPLRRTASFTNIEKIEEENGEDDEENDHNNRPANHQ